MASFVSSPGHSIKDRKSRLQLFLTKIAERTVKVDQGHRRWQSSVGIISLSISLKLRVYLVSFLRYSISTNGVPLKSGLGIISGH